jgi:hypothetical protein
MVQLLLKDKYFHLTFDLLFTLKILFQTELNKKLTFNDVVRKVDKEWKNILSELKQHFDYLEGKGLTEEEVNKLFGHILSQVRWYNVSNPRVERLKDDVKKIIGDKVEHEDDIVKNIAMLLPTYSKFYRIEEFNIDPGLLLENIDEVAKVGKISYVKKIFNVLANLRLIKVLSPEDMRKLREFINWMEKLLAPSELPLYHIISLLRLEPVSPIDVIKCLDLLVRYINYYDYYTGICTCTSIFSNYQHRPTFAMFLFLITHIIKRGFDGDGVINEIGYYRWKELGPLSTELLGYFIILLSLKRITSMRLALGLARSFISERERNKTTHLEDFCRGLLNIQRYGTDGQVKRILSYAYFYGDLNIIIKLGNLAEAEGSLKKALNLLRSRI